jgi:hypothetical protein
MNRLLLTAFAAVIAPGPLAALAADMTTDERAELRQRAEEHVRVRERNPAIAQDGMKLDRPQGDVKVPKPRGDVKAKPKSKQEGVKSRMKRNAKKVPGALVRDNR